MNLRVFLVGFLLIVVSAGVLAIPGIPHQFKGSVLINGNTAPNGTIVKATINGTDYTTTTVSGIYGTSPAQPFFVKDPNNNQNGDSITIFVNNVSAGMTVFQTGMLTTLNLAITQEQPPQPPGGNPSGGSGGGGSGGGSSGGGGDATPIDVIVSSTCINQDISVQTKYSNGNPLPSVTITVSKEGSAVISGTTDTQGVFSFLLSQTGSFELKAKKTGFLTKTLAIEFSDCSQNVELPKLPPGIEPEPPIVQPENTVPPSQSDSINSTPITGFFGLNSANFGLALGFLVLVALGAIYIGLRQSKAKKDR
ncbi:MAG: carboxypeptidase-like regulatory domain-containing protein [Candidatus Micrarchaeota archaeon]